MKYTLKTEYGTEKVSLMKGEYNNGGLYIALMLTKYEQWDDLSTWLPNKLTNNNCIWVEQKYVNFMNQNNIGMCTFEMAKSGFNTYFEYELSDDFLKTLKNYE